MLSVLSSTCLRTAARQGERAHYHYSPRVAVLLRVPPFAEGVSRGDQLTRHKGKKKKQEQRGTFVGTGLLFASPVGLSHHSRRFTPAEAITEGNAEKRGTGELRNATGVHRTGRWRPFCVTRGGS